MAAGEGVKEEVEKTLAEEEGLRSISPAVVAILGASLMEAPQEGVSQGVESLMEARQEVVSQGVGILMEAPQGGFFRGEGSHTKGSHLEVGLQYLWM